MRLSEKRVKFSSAVSALIAHMQSFGFNPAIDFVKRCSDCKVGHKRSCHKSGLAADIILYDSDFNSLESGAEHKVFRKFWEELGGARPIEGDLGHYSFEHNGIR